MSRYFWILRATVFSWRYLPDWRLGWLWGISESVYDNADEKWRGSPADEMLEEFSCWSD